MKYKIKNRFTGEVQFTADIDCEENACEVLKVGLAVLWAVKMGANLEGVSLDGAFLSGAILSGASLDGASVRGGIYRTDGYQFWIINTDKGPHIRAGCRWLSLPDARRHWIETRGGTPLGDETMLMLDFLEAEAKAAGWL